MKHGSLKIICLIIWACITVVPSFAQTVNLESKVLESFDGRDDEPKDIRYKNTDTNTWEETNAVISWQSAASRFTTTADDVTYPVLQYIDAWPVAVFGYNHDSEAPPLRSLGINGRFDRQGYNWIDIYPTLADNPDAGPVEISIPGKVNNFDMWVWGSNFNYYVEIYLRDYRGVVHSLKLGDLGYAGWRNLRVNVPSVLVQLQTRKTLPSYAGLYFVKFRIWTQPTERVDNFYVYFKQLKVLTDMFNELFDGNDLGNPAHVQELWANSNESNGASE